MRLINEQYLNTAETLRIRTEIDEDAAHPRKGDMAEPMSHFVAKHPRYTLGDEDAMSDLADALREILTDCASLDDEMVECPSCHGDDAYDDEGHLHLAEDEINWINCWSCHGTGIKTTLCAPGEGGFEASQYLGKTTNGHWNVQCSTCTPLAAHGHPGKIAVCRECQGDSEIENIHYVNTSDGPSLYKALPALDPDETRIFRLPVYMIDHSGIALSTTPYSCPWDSGQVGFIWMDKDTAERELGNHETIESLRDAAHRHMSSEIETLSQYVEGEVYGFICERYVGPEGDDKDIDDEDNWEEEDSCWGFFGMDMIENGMVEHWEDKYLDAFCEAEGITREQLEAEKAAWVKKVGGETAEAE